MASKSFWTEMGARYKRAISDGAGILAKARNGTLPQYVPEQEVPSASASAKQTSVPPNPIKCAIGLPRNVIWSPDPNSDVTEGELRRMVDIALLRMSQISEILFDEISSAPSADSGGKETKEEIRSRNLTKYMEKHHMHDWKASKLNKPGYLVVSFKMDVELPYMETALHDALSALLRFQPHDALPSRNESALASKQRVPIDDKHFLAASALMSATSDETPGSAPSSSTSSNSTQNDMKVPIDENED